MTDDPTRLIRAFPTPPIVLVMVVAQDEYPQCQDLLLLCLAGRSALCVVLFLTVARFCLAVSAGALALSAVSETLHESYLPSVTSLAGMPFW